MSSDRRRSPRIEIPDRLQGRSLAHGPVRVRDFSLGGMAIETADAFAVGDVEIFHVTLGDGSIAELHGRILRCQNIAPADEPPLYVSGVQFVEHDDAHPTSGDVIGKLRRD